MIHAIARLVFATAAIVTTACDGSRLPHGNDAVVRMQFPQHYASVLESSDEMIVYRLDPGVDDAGRPQPEQPVPGVDRFQGRRVLARTSIADPAERLEVIEAIYRGAAEAQAALMCHVPRFGIHVTRGTRVIDFAISYECGEMIVSNETGFSRGAPMSLGSRAVLERFLPRP